jgi:hypothetical protein
MPLYIMPLRYYADVIMPLCLLCHYYVTITPLRRHATCHIIHTEALRAYYLLRSTQPLATRSPLPHTYAYHNTYTSVIIQRLT